MIASLVRRPAAISFVMLVCFAGSSSGCGKCQVSCGGPKDPDRITVGRVVHRDERRDDGEVRFALANGSELQVRVYGQSSALKKGSEYRLPLYRDARGQYQASLPTDCDCGGPYITRLDGSAVPTGLFPNFDWQRTAIGFVIATAIVIAAWGAVRTLRRRRRAG
jgi:hypothetical protein